MAEYLQPHQPPPRHHNYIDNRSAKDVPSEVQTRERPDDELTANSPVTWEYPSPPRHPGGAVIHMTREDPNNLSATVASSTKRNPLLFGATKPVNTSKSNSKRAFPNLHLQRSSSSDNVFQEEYDLRDEPDNHGQSNNIPSHLQQKQQQDQQFSPDDELQHLQPPVMSSSSQRFYTRQLPPSNNNKQNKRRIQPTNPSEQKPKFFQPKFFYQSQHSSQSLQRDALIVHRDASRGRKPVDEESQTVMDETYQDDGRYCCGCRLSTIMISGCLIGLAMTIGAIAGLLIWDQALVESALGQSAQTPTMAPTVAAPTTSFPTPGPLGTAIWQEYRSTNTGSMFGSSVFILENWVAIGAPLAESVTTYVQSEDGHGRWDQLPLVSAIGETTGSNFGADIHLGKVYSAGPNSIAPFLVVGAPDANGGGKVYFYSRNQDTIDSGDWIQQGNPLTAENGEISAQTAAAGFGSAVAASDTLRVVVGAPTYGIQDTGRVYTYQYLYLAHSKTFEAELVVEGTLSGTGSPGANFGFDVDITEDANSLVVGEPGTSSFSIFKRETNEWITKFSFTLSEMTDLGSSVTFISPVFVAVGAPSANQNAGFVALFEYDEAKERWGRVKASINGSRGDRIGAKGTVAGSQGEWGTQIIVASESGVITRYDLIGDDLLINRFEIELHASVSAIDVEADEEGFAVLAGYSSNDFAALYGSSEIASASNPTDSAEVPASHPTESPTAGPTVSQPTSNLPAQTPPSSPGSAIANYQSSSGTLSGYGTSVAIAGNGNLLIIGEPKASNETGLVVFPNVTGDSAWSTVDSLSANGTQDFGDAMDLTVAGTVPFLLVGAPGTHYDSSDSSFGSAHVYKFDSTNWTPVGSVILPPISTLESGVDFGKAVSMATDGQRLVVGAPRTSDWTYNDIGRVYTYDWDGSDWLLVDNSLRGIEESFFGSSVALSGDGQSLVVGSPGSDQAFYYQWIEGLNQWNLVFTTSSTTGEAFGERVAFVSEDPYAFAVGGPADTNGRGVVRVFSKAETDGPFSSVGLEISGLEDGERVGKTLCGSQNKIAVGTDTGLIRIYTFQNAALVLSLTINAGSAIVSLDMSDDSNKLIAGSSDEDVWVYDITSS